MKPKGNRDKWLLHGARKVIETVGLDTEVKALLARGVVELGGAVPEGLRLDAADQMHLLLKQRPKPVGTGAGRVLFFPLGGVILQNLFEMVVMQALVLRGADVQAVVCDRMLPSCQRIHRAVTPDPEEKCANCFQRNRAFYRKSGFVPLMLGRLVTEEARGWASRTARETPLAEIPALVWEGVPVGKHAQASALRTQMVGELTDDPEDERALRDSLEAALLVQAACHRLLESERPDVVVISHGIYLWGVVADFFRERGVRVVVFNLGYRRNTAFWFHGETYHKCLVYEPNEIWETGPLATEDREFIEAYLDSRRTGSLDYLTYHPNPQDGEDYLRRELRLDPDVKTVGLFSNIAWDAALTFREAAFPNMLDWVEATIRHFANRREIQFVVRCHPAEVKREFETRQKLADVVRERFRPLPDNLRLVPAESDLSTYALSELVDLCVVYTTKVGLEFATRGVPVVVAGEAFYRGKGFTHDPLTREDYFRMLEELPRGERMPADRIARAKQYAYYYFYRRHMELPYFEPYSQFVQETRFTLSSLDELLPGRNLDLDLICEGILTGREVVRSADS